MTWANQTRLLQENFKALLTSIGSILTQVFKPVVKVLNAVIGHVIKFVKTVGDALGTIFGWTMLVREGGVFDDSEDESTVDFSDTVSGLEDVAKAAEEGAEALEEEKEEEEDLSRSIMGFDELNLLEPPVEEEEEEEDTGDELNNTANGANDAADAIENMGDAMEEAYVAIVPKESAFKSSIDTLGKLGEYIGDTLYNMLAGIEWDNVYEGARGFGKGLAEFLNGLITPELFGVIGSTLAGVLNTILEGLNSFAYTFDFPNLGTSLDAGVKGFVDNVNLPLFSDTLVAWGRGIAQTLNGLFNPETAGSVGNMLGEALNGIISGIGAFIDAAKWSQYGEALNKAIQGFIDAVDMSNVEYVFGKAGKAIADFLNALADPVLWSKIGSFIAGWLNAFVNFFLKFVENLKWDEWGKAIAAGMKSFMDSFDMENFQKLTSTLGTGIATFLNQLADKELWQKAGSFVAGWLNAIVGFFESFATKFDWLGWGTAINTGIQTFLNGIDWGAVERTVKAWGGGLANFINGLITPTMGGTVGNAVANFANNILEGLNSFGKKLDWRQLGISVRTFVNTALEKFDWKKLGQTINTWANGFLDFAIAFFSKLKWGALFNGLRDALDAIEWGKIASKAIEAIWTALKGENISQEDRDAVSDSITKIVDPLEKLAGLTFKGLEDLYNNALVPIGNWVFGEGLGKLANIVDNQLGNVDWDKLGKGIAGLATALGQFTIGVFEGLLGFFEGLSKLPGIGTLLNGLAGGLTDLFGSMDGKDKDTIKGIGEAVGAALGFIVAAKLTMTIVNAIKGLAATGVLPALLTAIVAHPVAAVVAGGVAVGTAIYAVMKSLKKAPELSEDVKAVSEAITQISDDLSAKKLQGDADYAVIQSVLDKYLELNEKIKNGEKLTEGEKTLLEMYYTQLTEYSGDMVTALGDLGTAYDGTREKLEGLLKAQAAQYEIEGMQETLKEIGETRAEALINISFQEQNLEGNIMDAIQEYINESWNPTHGVSIGGEDEKVYMDTPEFSTAFEKYLEWLKTGKEKLDGLNASTIRYYEIMKGSDGGTLAFETYKLNVEESNRQLDECDKLTDAVTGAIDELAKETGKTSGEVEQDFSSIEQSAKTHSDGTTQKIQNLPWVKKFSEVMEGMKLAAETKGKEVGDTAGGKVNESMTESINETSGTVADAAKKVISDAAYMMYNDETGAWELFTNSGEKICDNVVGALNGDVTVDEAAKKVLADAAESMNDENNPFWFLFSESGGLADNEVASGMRAGQAEVSLAVGEVMDGAKGKIDEKKPEMKTSGTEVSKTIGEGITENSGAVTSAAEESVVNPLEQLIAAANESKTKEGGKDWSKSYGQGITEESSKVTDAVQNDVLTPTDTLINQFNSKDVKENGQEFDTAYATGIKDNKSEVEGAADEIAEATVNPLDPGSGAVGGGGGGRRIGMFQRISGAGKSLGLTLKSEYIGGATKALGITGDGNSSVFDAIGGQTIGGMVDGVNGEFPNLKTFMENLPGNMKTVMGDVQTFFKPSGEKAVSGMKDGTTAKNGELEKYFVQLPTKMSNAMTTLESTFKSVGKLMGNSIIRGLESKTEDLKTAGNSAYGYVKGAFDTIENDLYTIGQRAMQALVNGLNSIRPHIPVPHFSVSMGYSGTTPYPVINGPAWYAKGGLATNASIVGIGEAGKEAILPLENRRAMQAIADSIASKSAMMDDSALENAMIRALAVAGAGGSASGENPIFNVVVKTENDEVLARAVTRGQKKLDYRHNAVSKM